MISDLANVSVYSKVLKLLQRNEDSQCGVSCVRRPQDVSVVSDWKPAHTLAATVL